MHVELTICKIMKLTQRSRGYTFVVVAELTSIFTFSALPELHREQYLCMSASSNHLHSYESIWQKNIFCWDVVQMLPRLVLIHGTACNADSQRSESWFECVWDVFTGHIWAVVRPQQNVLVLARWCKTVINVCSLCLPYFLLPILSPFVPQLLPLLSDYPITLAFWPFFVFIILPISSLILPLLYYYFLSYSRSPFVLQASELGMTSAFYKYILTTMVRVRQLFPFPYSVLSSFIFTRSSLLLFLLFCPFMSQQRCSEEESTR